MQLPDDLLYEKLFRTAKIFSKRKEIFLLMHDEKLFLFFTEKNLTMSARMLYLQRN
jgi:hypothetical protein